MRLLLPFVAATALCIAACDNSDDPVVVPTGTVTITSTADAATVPWTGTTTIPLRITRAGGFTGPVTLTAESVPNGVTVAFSPPTIADGATTATLTLTGTTSAVVGTSTIAVRASGSGINSGVVTLPITVGPPPGVTFTTGSTTALAAQGSAISIPIAVNRVGGYTGDVTLSVDNLAASSTATFSPATLSGDQRLTTLTLSPSATATAGTSALTIRATGTGMTAQTQVINYTVRAATTTGFGVSASPAALTVVAGQSATSTVTVTRTNNFPSYVDLSATGAPPGMTVSVAPNPFLTGTTTATVTTTSSTAPGTYPIVLTGVATGAANATASLLVVVTAPSGS